MIRISSILVAALFCSGAGYGAEYVARPEKATPNGPLPKDTEYELKWDTGVPLYFICWYSGAGSWIANDFNVSTLKTTHIKLSRLGVYSTPAWPNGRWDGFRVALWGGKRRCIIWPESGKAKYVKPSGPAGWKWFDVNWVLPKWNYSFLAAMEQRYNYPNCDPFYVDDNPTFRGHSWERYGGSWYRFSNWWLPYRNFMVRVYVETGHTFPGVKTTSIGRVKALYY